MARKRVEGRRRKRWQWARGGVRRKWEEKGERGGF